MLFEYKYMLKKTYSKTKITKHYQEQENWFRDCLGVFWWASKECWGKI